jgi:hypothetical protein
MASEPLDTSERDYWKAVPSGHVMVAHAGAPVTLQPIPQQALAAAE